MPGAAAILPAHPPASPEPQSAAPRPPVQRRLEVPDYDLAAALALERELGVSHVLAQVLVRRGLGDPVAAREFLHPREAHDPHAFAGIDRALEVIRQHLSRGARITVHGDYDVDGVCATAVLVRALRSLGGDPDWYLPSRFEDGYGVSEATIRRLAARGTELLITVDCGITAVQEVRLAHSLGLEAVVCDHHHPRADGALPDAPIVHPRLCGYPCPDLCGAAVALKLAEALGARSVAEDLELAALATVADLMPLEGENRRLVREGLGALANTRRPGLRALMAVAKLDPSALDAHAAAFRLAPRINAAGRLHRADAGLELLLSQDPARAAEVAAELDAANAQRRAVEQRIGWEAERLAAGAGERPIYVLAGEGWHPGVIGIVASRIVERFHRPAILIALERGLGTGSGRSIPGFDLLGALEHAGDHLERYGGHRAAAGLTIRVERLEEFRAALEAHAELVLTPDLLTPRERVDAVASASELGLDLAEELARLEPCGMGNPGARLLVPGARVDDLRAMGEGRHARFSVISGGARARAVAFGCGGKLDVPPGVPCDATFRLERNVWNGAVEPRLVLRHAQACRTSTIRVVGEPDHYLQAALAELDAPLQMAAPPASAERTVLDRRGESPLSVLADAAAAGGEVLAVCAEVSRRHPGLASRCGGFTLAGYHALERNPDLVRVFVHVVALDPPATAEVERLLRSGHGFTHLAWGDPELRFAQQINELEYALRASLITLYRGLRERGRVAGEELEPLLRGEPPANRPARVAGRLIRVLTELELVSLDRHLPALQVTGAARTTLERSEAYRAYLHRHQDQLRYLSSQNPLQA